VSRPLTWFDRCVKAPLGMVYLVFLLVVAVPVLIWMTVLYWVAEGFRSLRTRSRGGGSREAKAA
jgi:hypothetical protein